VTDRRRQTDTTRTRPLALLQDPGPRGRGPTPRYGPVLAIAAGTCVPVALPASPRQLICRCGPWFWPPWWQRQVGCPQSGCVSDRVPRPIRRLNCRNSRRRATRVVGWLIDDLDQRTIKPMRATKHRVGSAGDLSRTAAVAGMRRPAGLESSVLRRPWAWTPTTSTLNPRLRAPEGRLNRCARKARAA